MPLIPRKRGITRISGIRIIICLRRDKKSAGMALPSAWNIPEAITWMPIVGMARITILRAEIVGSISSISSEKIDMSCLAKKNIMIAEKRAINVVTAEASLTDSLARLIFLAP